MFADLTSYSFEFIPFSFKKNVFSFPLKLYIYIYIYIYIDVCVCVYIFAIIFSLWDLSSPAMD